MCAISQISQHFVVTIEQDSQCNLFEDALLTFWQGWVICGTSILEYGKFGLKYVYGKCRTGKNNKGLKYVISTAKYSI